MKLAVMHEAVRSVVRDSRAPLSITGTEAKAVAAWRERLSLTGDIAFASAQNWGFISPTPFVLSK